MTYGWDPHSGSNGGPGFVAPVGEPRLHVTLGDMPMTPDADYRGVPQAGVIWRVVSIDGWREPAESDTSTVRAPGGEGVLVLSSRVGPRSIIIDSNVISAPSEPWRVQQMIERLSRQREVALHVNEAQAGFHRELDVRLLSVRTSWRTPFWATVTLSLQADDPLRYGTSVLDLKSGRNVLLNPGDAVAFPRIVVLGPTNNFTITHAGGVFTLPNVPSTETWTVDGREGNVFDDFGNRVQVPYSPFPWVDRGGAEWQVAGLTSGLATVHRFEAWS